MLPSYHARGDSGISGPVDHLPIKIQIDHALHPGLASGHEIIHSVRVSELRAGKCKRHYCRARKFFCHHYTSISPPCHNMVVCASSVKMI